MSTASTVTATVATVDACHAFTLIQACAQKQCPPGNARHVQTEQRAHVEKTSMHFPRIIFDLDGGH